jgi:hypothetical protein
MTGPGSTAAADDLVARLGRFGDVIAVAETSVVEAVLERIAVDRPSSQRSHRGWLVAAAVILLVAVGVVLQPDARSAVADWFGLDGVVVEVDPQRAAPTVPDTGAAPGPGETIELVVDGQPIVVSAVRGDLTQALVTKVVGASDQVREITVDGHPGLWIAGSPHDVLYEDPSDDVIVERVARNTLLWTAHGVLYRVEGFEEIGDAVAYAEGT